MLRSCSMHDAPSLLECQRQFMAALYAGDENTSVATIMGNGLEPAARLRIYRHMCEAVQTDALRTTYPAVLALVGEAFFAQCARGYRRVHVSRTGNLQDFGAGFADYLATVPEARTLPYLTDVARLEWLHQEVALAADAVPLSVSTIGRLASTASVTLHPSVRRLASPHAVLTIFRYAVQPEGTRLQLPDTGENVVLWREDHEVAMAALDPASFACIEALARGYGDASADAREIDPEFDLSACISSFAQHGLIASVIRLTEP